MCARLESGMESYFGEYGIEYVAVRLRPMRML